MENKRSYVSGFSNIGITAALSIFVLLAASGWQIKEMVQQKNIMTSYIASSPERGTNPAPIEIAPPEESTLGSAIFEEVVSRYSALQEQGMYTEDVGAGVATIMAEALSPAVPYHSYTSSDIKTDSDTSVARQQKYSDDLRASLAPMRVNTQPEFEIFAYYIATQDTKYLKRLKEVAQYYRDAAKATAQVVTPADAVTRHVAILNAMEKFASTLDALALNAADPYASVALLRTYNEAEAEMYSSFKAFASYYKQKNS